MLTALLPTTTLPSYAVNAVGPGSIDTDVLASVVRDKAAMTNVLSRIPMLRIGKPSEIGRSVGDGLATASYQLTKGLSNAAALCASWHPTMLHISLGR